MNDIDFFFLSVLKSLLLLAYLVRNGSERIVTSAREHIYDLRSLESYTYIDEIGKDQGINSRLPERPLLSQRLPIWCQLTFILQFVKE